MPTNKVKNKRKEKYLINIHLDIGMVTVKEIFPTFTFTWEYPRSFSIRAWIDYNGWRNNHD